MVARPGNRRHSDTSSRSEIRSWRSGVHRQLPQDLRTFDPARIGTCARKRTMSARRKLRLLSGFRPAARCVMTVRLETPRLLQRRLDHAARLFEARQQTPWISQQHRYGQDCECRSVVINGNARGRYPLLVRPTKQIVQIVLRHERAAQRSHIGLRLLMLDQTFQRRNVADRPRVRPGARSGNIRFQPLDRLRQVGNRFRRREHASAISCEPGRICLCT